MVSTSMTSFLMDPMKASLSPTFGSSNFGQSTPGVSRSSMPSPQTTHWFERVTPGRFATCSLDFELMRLMNEDLPVFGMPTTMSRSGRPLMPFALFCSMRSASALRTSGTKPFRPFPVLQSTDRTKAPLLWK